MPLQGTYATHSTQWVRTQIDTILETGTTASVDIRGRAVVMVTMHAKEPGVLRRIPLMRVEHDGAYALVASIGGAPKHPRWYYNLKRNPQVDLQDGTETGVFFAREVTGEEKALWWERAVAAYPDYADYQRRTDREIPVFVLEPLT
jgi:deazaflavin-dependent oxidoreductase (nitroreductase family)